MVEKCTRCGRVLRPTKIAIAYHGKLYCSTKCCIDKEISIAVQTAQDTNNKIITATKYAEILNNVRQMVMSDSEEVLGLDIGISYPYCPLTKQACNSNCALNIEDECAIQITAKKSRR